jgi:beta-phosphoglucomutase-like phosphatase (HAD superfamily)
MIREAVTEYLRRQDVNSTSESGKFDWNFKCVLFDMDGVLYDSMPNHAIAWQESMAKFGIHMTAADAYATEGARGIDTIKKFMHDQLGKDITLDEAQTIYDEKTRIFHNMPTAPIFDGVKDIMEKITKSGMSVNVVTGSGQRPLIERLLKDFGKYLDEDHITTAYDVKRGKPFPDPYLIGLRKAGCTKPTQGIVVENAPLGVKSGVSAGIFTVAINSGPLSDSALKNEGANILYHKMTEFCLDWDKMF